MSLHSTMAPIWNIFNAGACISDERTNVVFVFGRRETGKTYVTQEITHRYYYDRNEHTFVIGGKDAVYHTITVPSAKYSPPLLDTMIFGVP